MEDKNELYIVAIVGLIAVVALVVLVLTISTRATPVSVAYGDTTGQVAAREATWKVPCSTDSDCQRLADGLHIAPSCGCTYTTKDGSISFQICCTSAE